MRLKNEAIVGMVVVLGIIVMVISSYWLSGRPWARAEQEVVAIFREVGQLRAGNPVVYRGVSVGRVTGVELSGDGRGVYVTMAVDPDIVLQPDAAVVLAPQSLFGDWQAQIASRQRFPELEFTLSTRPEVLPGAALPDISELTAVAANIAGGIQTLSERFELAFTEETAIKLRQTVENVQEISEQLTGFVTQQTRVYDGVSGNVLAATDNIRQATQRVERVAGQFEASIEQGEIQDVLTNVRLASENLRDLSLQLQGATVGVPGLIARADTAFITFGTIAQDVQVTLRSLEPSIAEIGPTIAEARLALATLQRAGERIENGEGTLGRLLEDPALYEETQAAVATLRRLMADIQANPARYVRNVRVF
jgi:phospholipid/cholesterol/gamma-HCH transport system substrate-binding protein